MSVPKKIFISICMGSACFARGNDRHLDTLEQIIKNNKLDAEIELIGERCVDLCEKGPIIKINDKYYENINDESIIQALKNYSPNIKY